MSSFNKIIGSGLIARSLMDADFGRPTLVLASGVANSQETRAEEFHREVHLVEQAIAEHPNLHVLYCSTCSIESGIRTPYTTHKLDMERRVMSAAAACHIFRLPQIVGMVHNHTLISHFVKCMLQGEEIRVQTRATRNLVDVRDFARVAALLVQRNAGAGVPQNIASSKETSVTAIVAEIAMLLERSANIVLVDGGYSQTIDISFLRSQLLPKDPLLDPNHWKRILQNYVPQIADNILHTKA